MAKRNSNIVSLTKAEKSATITALQNQINLLDTEPESSNPVVNKIVVEQMGTLQNVINKLAGQV